MQKIFLKYMKFNLVWLLAISVWSNAVSCIQGEVIVGRVINTHIIPTPDDPARAVIVYTVEYLGGDLSKISVGTAIRLQGVWTAGASAMLQAYIPMMSQGTTFTCFVRKQSNSPQMSDIFSYAFPGFSPYGISGASPLASNEVQPFLDAMATFDKLETQFKSQPDAALKAAWKLVGSKNYFLYSLGVWEIAKNGSKSDLDGLLSVLSESRPYQPVEPNKDLLKTGLVFPPVLQSPWFLILNGIVLNERQALWIVCCLNEVAPPDHRPSIANILSAFDDYAARVLSPESSGFIRWSE
ncbi:MAG TPA: hypothetical protein VKJ65_12555 [Phycisphaerae bacterium]|nr:hypothetical protein [Phycisphaerae bacterium]